MQTIRYRTRDIGYGNEAGIANAYVTDEVDAWGKRTILVCWPAAIERWYLFPNEWEYV